MKVYEIDRGSVYDSKNDLFLVPNEVSNHLLTKPHL